MVELLLEFVPTNVGDHLYYNLPSDAWRFRCDEEMIDLSRSPLEKSRRPTIFGSVGFGVVPPLFYNVQIEALA